jgi:undecaprenyl-diphosphatase
LDFILTAVRNKFLWIPLYVLVLSWILFNLSVKQWAFTFLFVALAIFASDTISSEVIKKQIKRPRPCAEMTMEPPAIQRIHCGGGYSFTSSHATNHFCIAAFMVILFGGYMRRWKYLWWGWAALISLAQVYVGVHYPLDVFFGGLLGIMIGASAGVLCKHRIKLSF